MNSPTDNLRERLNAKWPASARAISNSACAAFDDFMDRRGRLNPDKADYTEAVREAAKPAGKAIATAIRDLEKSLAKLDADRTALRAKAFAARSADGAEIRAYLRDLPPGQVAPLLLGPTADRAAQRAVLEAAPLLTNLSDELRQRVESEFLAAIFSDDTAAFDATDAALTHAKTSIELARGQIERDGQFSHGRLSKSGSLPSASLTPRQTITPSPATQRTQNAWLRSTGDWPNWPPPKSIELETEGFRQC